MIFVVYNQWTNTRKTYQRHYAPLEGIAGKGLSVSDEGLILNMQGKDHPIHPQKAVVAKKVINVTED